MRRTSFVALVLSFLSSPLYAAISGSVVSPDGQPVAGARVSIHALESNDARHQRLLSASPEAVPLASTQTDAKGNFSLQSPKESVVELRVTARGYAPSQRTVEADDDTGVISLTKTETSTGRVTAAGKPVAGATVAIRYDNAEYLTKTDEQGRYEAPDFTRARQIIVLHKDYAIDEELFFSPMGGRTPASEMNRALTGGTTLTGRVVASDAKTPVANAAISLDQWPLAVSGEDGTFTLAHVPPKWQLLLARKDSLLAQRAFSTDKSVTLRMERGAILSGRVTDAKTKVPVSNATIRLGTRRFGGSSVAFSALTDAKGAYSLVVPPASMSLMASHPSYTSDDIDVAAAAGQQVTRDFALQQRARISGVVVDEAKRPVSGATVAAQNPDQPMGRMPMRIMRDGGGVISGIDGRFTMRVAADQDVRLRATKKGLPTASGDTLHLAAGERKTGVVLTIPSGIAVSGRVTDDHGDPLSGVAVSAVEAAPGRDGGMRRMFVMNFGGEEEDVVRTAGDGTFSMRLKEGMYDFTFRREGYAPKPVRAQTISAAGTNTIETSLEPAVEITGRVTRGGMGIEGVNLFSFGSGDSSATTGPDGSFTIGGLSPGMVRLMLRKEDDFIQEQRNLTAPARDVNIELPAGGRISGHVVEKGTRKAITSFNAGVSTSRSGGGMVMMGPPQLRDFTSEDGSFTLENVPAGAVNLVVTAPGYSSGRMNVDVQEGKPVSDLTIELDAGVRLVGKVTAPNGSPLSDVRVQVAPSPTGSFARTGSIASTSTDANGEYTLDSLESGEETIEFEHPKYVAMSRSVALKGKETRLDVQLSGGITVSGTVTTDSGMPVADAEVGAFASGGTMRNARTNASGQFELESLSPARYRITAEKAGYTDGVLEDVDVSAGAPVHLVLRTGGTIYGHITGLTEQELGNATVEARSGRNYASTAVDPSGNFKIEGAPTGTVQVTASVMSRATFTRRTSPMQTVEVSAGSAQQVNIDFRNDTVVRGRVTRNGAPLGGANVSFYSPNTRSQTMATVSADEQGNYTVSGLEPGEYSVNVSDMQRFSGYSTTYTVRGSGTFDIAFNAGSVRGRVVDATTNEPIADANVQFRPSAADTRIVRGAMSDPNGAFTLDYIAPGPYVVTASKEGYGGQPIETRLDERGGEDVEIRLSRTAGVTLRVVDGRDNRPITAAAVVFDAVGRIVNPDGGMMRFGDATPEDMKLSLAPGQYTATVTSFGYAARSVTFTSPSTQVVAMTPGGTIMVQSRESRRRHVRLTDASGMIYPRYGSRAVMFDIMAGTLPIEHVAPGTYALQIVNDEGSVEDSVQVVVREGETVSVGI